MKLLHILTTLDVGGAEMHVLTQVRGQCARGHEVRIAYLLGEGTLVPDFEAAGASWVGCVGKGPGALWKLRPHLRWSDVAHTHLLRADFLGAAAATLWGRRSRLVAGKHNDEQALTRPMVSRVHGVIGNLPKRTIVLSDHVGRFIEQHGRVKPQRMTRIYYGIDPTPWEEAARLGAEERAAIRAEFGFGADDIVFLCVARFAPQKAHEVLLAAFAQARSLAEERGDLPQLRLLLVGDDPFFGHRPKAEAVAQELGLLESGACVFAGIRRDVPRLIGASDVFTMASRWEGLGLVFLEAMAAGLAVVSTRVSAIPEVVVEDETGLLVPPDDAHALSQALLDLAADPERRAALGEAGRVRVREVFGLDRMVEETLTVYREVAQG